MNLSDVIAKLPPRSRTKLVQVLLVLKADRWDGHVEEVYDVVLASREETLASVHAAIDDVEDAGLCLLCGCYDAHGPHDCDQTEDEDPEVLTEEYVEDVMRDFEALSVDERGVVLAEIRRSPMSLVARDVYMLAAALAPEDRLRLAERLEREAGVRRG